MTGAIERELATAMALCSSRGDEDSVAEARDELSRLRRENDEMRMLIIALVAEGNHLRQKCSADGAMIARLLAENGEIVSVLRKVVRSDAFAQLPEKVQRGALMAMRKAGDPHHEGRQRTCGKPPQHVCWRGRQHRL